jgi:hypothetical protein
MMPIMYSRQLLQARQYWTVSLTDIIYCLADAALSWGLGIVEEPKELPEAGQANRDDCADSKLALEENRSAVLLSDPASDGKTKAGTAGVTAPGWIRTVEALKDVLLVVGRDADARVAHYDLSQAVLGAQAKGHDPICRGILDGIVKQDEHQLAEPILIA